MMKDNENMTEEELDKELHGLIEEMPESRDLASDIEKIINKKIRKIVFRTTLAILAVLAAVFIMISPLMNMAYTNPEKLNKEPDPKVLSSLRAYFEVMYPYNEVASLQIEKVGFSRYMFNMQILDHTGPISIGRQNVKIEMFKGNCKVKEDTNNMVTKMLGQFEVRQSPSTKKELEKLPKSAMIYLSVGEINPRPVSEIRKEKITLEWLQVNQPNLKFQGGISMNLSCLFKDTDDRRGMTEEELKKIYISNLQELLNTDYIWKDLGLSSGSIEFTNSKEFLQNCLNDAEKISVLTTKNYCVSGSKDQILNYLKNTNIKFIHVDKIRLSSLN
ncbi:sigma factor regulator N-terminal domain-containing protein [Clostridium sp.]|uniref:sigma factor regulator N-terminal domain-containing protein n=1 Tax=Clostridium sp. TaxID=1506 RepID=UPI003D6C9752